MKIAVAVPAERLEFRDVSACPETASVDDAGLLRRRAENQIPARCVSEGSYKPLLTRRAGTIDAAARLNERWRLLDYIELTKPRIAALVLFTVAAGFLLASRGAPDFLLLANVLIGTALVAGGASALNQLLERRIDARMQRTKDRPLPSGRLQPTEVLLAGIALGAGGLLYLTIFVGQPLCVAVAAITFASYVGLYTPLKRITTLNTVIGAVPGALPPIIGWTAASGSLSFDASIVFLVLFLWQIPHFLAIAWIYRNEYAGAGLKMLPGADETGRITGRQMILYCLCLVGVTLLPVSLGQAGGLYLAGVLLVGGFFLFTAIRFYMKISSANARSVLRASLVYLPVLLLLLVLNEVLTF